MNSWLGGNFSHCHYHMSALLEDQIMSDEDQITSYEDQIRSVEYQITAKLSNIVTPGPIKNIK